jgi:hypothetical protein
LISARSGQFGRGAFEFVLDAGLQFFDPLAGAFRQGLGASTLFARRRQGRIGRLGMLVGLRENGLGLWRASSVMARVSASARRPAGQRLPASVRALLGLVVRAVSSRRRLNSAKWFCASVLRVFQRV